MSSRRWSVKLFDWSNGLDTALYINIPLVYLYQVLTVKTALNGSVTAATAVAHSWMLWRRCIDFLFRVLNTTNHQRFSRYVFHWGIPKWHVTFNNVILKTYHFLHLEGYQIVQIRGGPDALEQIFNLGGGCMTILGWFSNFFSTYFQRLDFWII